MHIYFRWVFPLLGIIAVILAGYLWLEAESRQMVTLTNDSSFPIVSAEIRYSGQLLTLNNIEPYSTVQRAISAETDGSFDVKFLFGDGYAIEKTNLGYVTRCDGSNSVFIINTKRFLSFEQK